MIFCDLKHARLPKIITCAVAFLMCLCMLMQFGLIESVSADDTVKETELAIAGKVSKAATIDGKLDEDFWSTATWNGVASRQVATVLNNTCEFATAWDSKNFYVAIKVADATVVKENLNEQIYNNDGIEIFIDPMHVKQKGKYDKNTLRLFYQVADGSFDMMGGTGILTLVKDSHPNVKAAHTITDDGYIVEAVFPFADLGIEKPQDGMVMGFEVTNNDDDSAATNTASDRMVLYWNEDTYSGNPSTWGNVCLYENVKPVLSNYGTATLDGVNGKDENWVFTTEVSSKEMTYQIASMCDDKNLYFAIDLKSVDGYDLSNAGLKFYLDPDHSKGKESETIIQVYDYDFKNNKVRQSTSTMLNQAKGDANGYFIEMSFPLNKMGVSYEYFDTIGMTMEIFTVVADTKQPTAFWEVSHTYSPWKDSTGFGTVLINTPKISGVKNSAPFGSQIASYSIAEGTTLSGKAMITDADGDALTFCLDPNNKATSEKLGTFELNESTGEWTYTPPANTKMADTIVNYYIQADDGTGATFHQRIEIRIGRTPTYKTYHVDGDIGKDTNDGLTPEKALKTIQVAQAKARPGDTIIIHESEIPYLYQEKAELNLTKSGLPGAYITYKAAEGEQPVIRTSSNNWGTINISGSYIILDGLTVRGNGKDFLPDMAENYGYYYQRLTGGGLHANVTKFNTNGISFTTPSGKGPGDLGIDKVEVVHHVEIRNCVVEFTGGGGIGGSNCDYITIENNTINNCNWGDMWACSGISVLGNIDIDNNFDEHKIIIRNNITAGNRHFVPWISVKKFSDGNGIIVDSTDNAKTNKNLLEKGDKWGLQAYQGRFLIANNLVYYNGGSGIHAFNSYNVDIINNTIFANGSTPQLSWGELFSNAAHNVNMFNNIVYSRTGNEENISGTSSSEVVYDNNLFFNYGKNNLGKNIAGKNGKEGTTAGANNIYGEDPLFTKVEIVNYDQGKGYPSDWTDYMREYAKDGGYFIGADYDVTLLDFDFTLKEGSPALGSGNKEWSDKLGNTDNNMGIFGTVGSPLRSVSVSDVTPSTDRFLGEALDTEEVTAADTQKKEDTKADDSAETKSDDTDADCAGTDTEQTGGDDTQASFPIGIPVVAAVVIVAILVACVIVKKNKNKAAK